jgi:hypothetical protein
MIYLGLEIFDASEKEEGCEEEACQEETGEEEAGKEETRQEKDRKEVDQEEDNEEEEKVGGGEGRFHSQFDPGTACVPNPRFKYCDAQRKRARQEWMVIFPCVMFLTRVLVLES